MKIFRGKKEIGTISEYVEVTIDYDDLFVYRGERKSKVRVERLIGYLILFLGFSGLVILLTILNETNFSISSTEIFIACISLLFISYASFLLRDRSVYDFNTENKKISYIKKALRNKAKIKVEIDDYIMPDVLDLIDYHYVRNYNDFFYKFSLDLLKDKTISELVEKRLAVDVDELKRRIVLIKGISFGQNNKSFFINLLQDGLTLNADKIDKRLCLYSLAKTLWKEALVELECFEVDVNGLGLWLKNEFITQEYNEKWRKLSSLKPKGAINRSYTSRATPLLDKFGTDFTNKVIEEGFKLSLGRDGAIHDILLSLQKEKKSAILVLGETGVGKTRVLKHVASMLVVEDIPRVLYDQRFVVLDLSTVFVKVENTHDFVRNIKSMFDEVHRSGNIIIGIENMTNIFMLPSDIRGEVISLLIGEIEDKNIKIVATAQTDVFNRYAKQYQSFMASFSKTTIYQPDKQLTTQILLDTLTFLEEKHKINVPIEIIKLVAEHSQTMAYEKALPDKAIDLLESIMIRAVSRHMNFVSRDIVESFIEERLGVDIGTFSEAESSKLLKLEDELHKKIIGQVNAVRAVSSALRRARAGISKSNKPVASFLFYGPTGVGKTEIARVLSSVYFGNKNLFHRLNMSEFSDDSGLRRLLGYYDSEDNFIDGILTSRVKDYPYSLILLDELEKASTNVLDLFLQVLDDGYITDGAGKKISFENNIIIATSNAGSLLITELFMKGKSIREVEPLTVSELYKSFRVEFINRFDKVIMFTPLSKFELQKIAGLLLKSLAGDLEEKGIIFEWNERTEHDIVKRGYNIRYGARELRRVIQDTIEDKIATMILEKHIRSGTKVIFDGLQISNIT